MEAGRKGNEILKGVGEKNHNPRIKIVEVLKNKGERIIFRIKAETICCH